MLGGAHFERFDERVATLAEEAFEFLERLVAAPSTVGQEQLAQEIVAGELAALGFEVTRPPVPEAIAEHPLAGVPQASYSGRYDVLGRLNGPVPGLLFNGHIDVVPADASSWSTDPFRPVRADGWMVGRGTGDMKGGFAMVWLALRSLAVTMPQALEQPLGFLSVIEEECTGNGTLAAVAGGVGGRAVILPEPSDLGLLLAGVGVLWVDIELHGAGGHAHAADQLVTPVSAVMKLTGALDDLGRRLSRQYPDAELADVAQPYTVNVGRISCGNWRSSVAPSARLGVRVGYPRGWSPDQALAVVAGLVDQTLAADLGPNLRVTVEASGFRAEGYFIDPGHELVRLVGACHQDAVGLAPRAFGLGSTTDARYYLNQLETPALCYGPVARNIHGSGEAVLLQSIVDGARTLGRVIASFAGGPEGLGGNASPSRSSDLTNPAP